MLLDHCYEFGLLLLSSGLTKFFEEGDPPPVTYLASLLNLDPPLGRYGQNIFTHVPGHEHFIPTKFRKHPLSGSVVKAGNAFLYIYMHSCTPPPPPPPFSPTVNVVIFAGGKFRENVGKTFHMGVIFAIFLIFP